MSAADAMQPVVPAVAAYIAQGVATGAEPLTSQRAVTPSARSLASHSTAKVALLGTGTVGSAVIARLKAWESNAFAERLSLQQVANSRSVSRRCLNDGQWREVPRNGFAAGDIVRALGTQGVRIVIDATASEEIAEHHALWLAQGVHVVTACKLGQGGDLSRWRTIRDAQRIGGTCYGDSATVGAGLPVLSSIRALRAGGDSIHTIAGVLSGSLAWLFHHYDGLRPFSGFVRQACDAGYTEPDPRDDLSGEDVRRKILILARAAGVELDSKDVDVESLVPPELAWLPASRLDDGLPALDAPLRERYAAAYKRGEKLRFVARLEHGRARVGLECLPAEHPLVGGSGTDNRVAIWSDRYREQPLLIQGPGAGADVTAAALLDDALAIAQRAAQSVTGGRLT
jgi:homoserine dehydrogenase